MEIRGLPIVTWSVDNFSNIAGVWGDYLAIEKRTEELNDFDMASILIVTNKVDSIHEKITVKFQNFSLEIKADERESKDFNVRYLEESSTSTSSLEDNEDHGGKTKSYESKQHEDNNGNDSDSVGDKHGGDLDESDEKVDGNSKFAKNGGAHKGKSGVGGSSGNSGVLVAVMAALVAASVVAVMVGIHRKKALVMMVAITACTKRSGIVCMVSRVI